MKGVFSGNGKKNVLIISGVHGNEKTPLAITEKILKEPNEFSKNFKNLKVLHAVNKPALDEDSRFIDDFDLNRAFHHNNYWDEDPELVSEIKGEIEEADFIIDIHSSPSCVELLAIDQNQYAESFVKFASGLEIPCVVQQANKGSIKDYCLNMGKPCFTFEVNKLMDIDKSSANKGFKMIKEMVDRSSRFEMKESNILPKENKKIFTKENCLILPVVNVGDTIKPKQTFAYKLNSNDGSLTHLKSSEPYDTQVITSAYTDYHNEDEILECNMKKNNSLFTIF